MMINVGEWTGNGIGDEGARMIIESLKSNSTLTKLELERNEIWNKMKFYKSNTLFVWHMILKEMQWKKVKYE